MASQASLDIEKLTIVFDDDTKHQSDITRLLCYNCGTAQAFIICDLCGITTRGECSREFAYRYEGIAFFFTTRICWPCHDNEDSDDRMSD